MDYYPDRESNTIYDKLDVVVRMMDGAAALSTAALHPSLTPTTHGYDPNPRGKYIRVWAQGWHMPSECPACTTFNRSKYAEGAYNETVRCNHPDDIVKVPTQRMVCFFVEKATGDVWKAAGWKAPALNFTRGNINDRDGRWAVTGGKMSPQGYFYGGF